VSKSTDSHPFWGPQGPLSTLSGGALIILASPRLAFALITVLALIFVYMLSALAALGAKKIIPRKARPLTLIFIASFFSGLFSIILSLASPLFNLDLNLMLLLVPISFINTPVVRNFDSLEPDEGIYQAVLETLMLGGIITGLALIREPLGYGALSIPGSQGVIEWAFAGGGLSFLPGLISTSAGAFMLLGYGMALFRKLRKEITGKDD
jgi:ABC-type polysaccharide/polyol phosphate export permease